jgi:hypothetical protein
VGEYLVATNDAPVHLLYEDLATELAHLAGLVAGDDLRMLLEEAQEFLWGRKVLTFEDAEARLSNPLLYQRQEVLEALKQASGSTTSILLLLLLLLLLQPFNDFPGLSAARLGDRDQLWG